MVTHEREVTGYVSREVALVDGRLAVGQSQVEQVR
jgi:hypothetical protein